MPHRSSLPLPVPRRATPAAALAACLAAGLAAGLAAAPVVRAQQPAADSTYATPALRALVASAARGNQLPPDLVAYKARVETEIAVAARYDTGTEAVVALEQIATTLRWTRTGHYDQHIVGYRAQQFGLTVSMLGNVTTGWATPTLYGNRLRLRRSMRDSSRVRRRASTDTLAVVHPLADDRDAYYRFAGGDTVVTLRAGSRSIPIVRVQVEPRPDLTRRAGLFRGELELDATRHHIVRMRGHFLVAPQRDGVGARLLRAAVHGYAFVEYVNAERDGRFWLPAYQRIDLQAASAAMGDTRGVVHIVSRFRDYALNDTTLSPAHLAAADSLRQVLPRRLTRAPADTLERYADWERPIGAVTAETHGDDFLDVAPDRWRPTGAPRLELAATRGSDLFHYNRVEGAYTGLAGRVRFRDAAPGLTLRAAAGWAWAEETVRGRVEVERAFGERGGGGDGGAGRAAASAPRWTLAARAGRSLDLTNDFRLPMDSGSTIAALLFSQDDYDYVDRRVATLAATRSFGARAARLRVEAGVGSDRGVAAHATRGLFTGDSLFRPNRPADAGRYARAAATLELRPDVSGDFLRPGLGARLHWELGAGDLDWQRLEARVAGRRTWAPSGGRLAGSTVVAAARADAGILLSPRPPRQQLFELGDETLYGYGYKEFAGDRASVARASLMWLSPWLLAPLRVARGLVLPGPNPGLSVGVQAGWADASDAAARAAVAGLGARTFPTDDPPPGAPGPLDPESWVSRPTDGVRASVVAGVRLFGGSTLVGAARPIDRRGRWTFVLSFAQML